MLLSTALALQTEEVVALVGAGGKTTAMARLARELVPLRPVISSTTTHLALAESSMAPAHLVVASAGDLERLGPLLRAHRHVLVTGPEMAGQGKWSGLTPELFSRMMELVRGAGVTVLVEADGARGLPLKAPEFHEPALPREATQLVALAGLDGLGRILDAESVHRAPRFAQWALASMGSTITPLMIARALTHPASYPKSVRSGMTFSIVLNKAEGDEAVAEGRATARAALQSSSLRRVAIANLTRDHPVRECRVRMAGIILAAGAASRMGSNKLLLPVRGEPMLQHVVNVAREHVQEVIVVLGAQHAQIEAAIDLRGTRVVSNPAWRDGQSTSLRAGLEAVGDSCGAGIFFLGDQPNVPGAMLDRMLDAHAKTLAPIVAPRHAGRRANPVLFDRVTWDDLRRVAGDEGGRGLFNEYRAEWVDWPDPRAFADIDTPDDYRGIQSPKE
jgi:molybdenum cofactor cytidylyltransferase